MEEPVAGTSSSSMSNAEKLRQRRRQRILANQDSRIGKILGTEPSQSSKMKLLEDQLDQQSFLGGEEDASNWSSLSRPGESIEEMEDNGVTIIRRKVRFADNDNIITDEGTTWNNDLLNNGQDESSSSNSSEQVGQAGFLIPQSDGSTIHPKLSTITCRILVCILGACLSLFNAKFFLITFFSWEFAVFVINGLPDDEASSSIVLLVALLGVKDVQLKRIKFFIKISSCIWSDFSILLVSSLLTRILFQTFMAAK